MDAQVNGAAMMPQPVGVFAGQQFAPQGFFGDLISQVGAPLGGAIGSVFGNQGAGQARRSHASECRDFRSCFGPLGRTHQRDLRR